MFLDFLEINIERFGIWTKCKTNKHHNVNISNVLECVYIQVNIRKSCQIDRVNCIKGLLCLL